MKFLTYTRQKLGYALGLLAAASIFSTLATMAVSGLSLMSTLHCSAVSLNCFLNYLRIGFPPFLSLPHTEGDIVHGSMFSVPFLLVNLVCIWGIACGLAHWQGRAQAGPGPDAQTG